MFVSLCGSFNWATSVIFSEETAQASNVDVTINPLLSPALECCMEKVSWKLNKVNLLHSFYVATRGLMKNILMYNGAHHVQAFSGLKINRIHSTSGEWIH